MPHSAVNKPHFILLKNPGAAIHGRGLSLEPNLENLEKPY